MLGSGRRSFRTLRRFLKHDVGVSSSDAKCTYTSTTKPLVVLPIRAYGRDPKGAIVQVKLGIRALEVQRRRKYAVFHDMRCVDQPGNAGSDIQMPHVGLGSSYCAESFTVGGSTKCLGQSGELDRVA